MFQSVFHATALAGSYPLGTSQRMAAYSAYCMYAIRSCRPRAGNVIVIRTSNLHGRVSMDSRLNRSATNRAMPAAARLAAPLRSATVAHQSSAIFSTLCPSVRTWKSSYRWNICDWYTVFVTRLRNVESSREIPSQTETLFRAIAALSGERRHAAWQLAWRDLANERCAAWELSELLKLIRILYEFPVDNGDLI